MLDFIIFNPIFYIIHYLLSVRRSHVIRNCLMNELKRSKRRYTMVSNDLSHLDPFGVGQRRLNEVINLFKFESNAIVES